jgi:tRNA A58 N-methylase Trm61
VADIGTGVGYMLPYLSRAVGPSGRVLAEDIFDDFLGAAKRLAADQKLGNVAFIKAPRPIRISPMAAWT